MTGLRSGELIALRWRDVDWPASAIRVRSNYVCGEFGSPKSKRSTRSVPMADQVAGELERYYQASGEPAEGELVFPSPKSGGPARQVGGAASDAPCAEGREAGRGSPLPRSQAHVWNGDGRGRGADADPAGVDGPPRYPDDTALCGLRATDAGRGARGRGLQLRQQSARRRLEGSHAGEVRGGGRHGVEVVPVRQHYGLD